MKLFYGKAIHITVAIIGIMLIGYSIYYLGRADEVQQILNIVKTGDDVTLYFHDRFSKDTIPIHVSIKKIES